MTVQLSVMTEDEVRRLPAPSDEAGLGALRTERGNLPLAAVDVRADIVGLAARVRFTQDFVNGYDTALEATYVFPMPDRAAVTGMVMTADGRTVEARLQERGEARAEYDRAVAAGQRASIAEEERPDVFTMRVGNILPGERVSVALTLVTPLSYEDGEATFRFPLVVAPRYIPGSPVPGPAVGAGYGEDTDAVPDASRITPPILLPGFPNPVRLSIDVGVDAGGLPLSGARASLPVVSTDDGRYQVRLGERLDRDFILRLRYAAAESVDALVLVPDADGDEGTYQLTVLPPTGAAPPRPRDVVLVLDRSGSMAGWKMVAARRAAARIVDTLTAADRFTVLTFDDRIERPDDLTGGLVAGTDRNRYRAVEHLARVDARGGTEILAPLREALNLLGAPERDSVLVLVTDGQVGNEDQIVHALAADLRRVRVHTVGIDQAVNAGFLGRLAAAGGGRCELVESEDRLDDAMDAIHRRIGAPLVSGLRIEPDGLALVDDTRAPARVPDLFPGVPLVVAGRYTGSGGLVVRGTTRDGQDWSMHTTGQQSTVDSVTKLWARAHLRELEDRYVAGTGALPDLEKRIVDTSLRFGVLCRFTAYVAVDSRVVAEGGPEHRVVQPVELPAGWAMPVPPAAGVHLAKASFAGPSFTGPMMAAPAPMMAPQMMAPPSPGGAPLAFEALDRGAPPAVPPVLTEARELVSEELVRLRVDPAGLPGYQRREMLADLASRLRAMLAHLRSRGVAEETTAPVRRLVEAIEAGGDADALWREAVRVLEAFLGGGAPSPQRRAFWKR
jgi:Ca-activated chloride channel family protein